MSRRIETLLLPTGAQATRERLDTPLRCAIVGGGIAGVAAAVVLAERGAQVVLYEREGFLGGRAGAWSEQLADGTSFEMERGFHAFFRQYYNLRALLRRIDPELAFLKPLEDYPILGSEGWVESFRGLPKRTPWNVIALTWRTKTMGLRDLLRVDGRAALEMLRYDESRTFERFDERSAGAYLDSLRFPAAARRMLFDVFAHSFFNPEGRMSAGELLAMFHFYFAGNTEGLIFDVAKRPFSTAIWRPFERWFLEHGVEVRSKTPVERLERGTERAWNVVSEASCEAFDVVVLATEVSALQGLVERSSVLHTDPDWHARIVSLSSTLPFAVWRLWLDRRVNEDRAPFVGTTGVGLLDNISVYELLEDESRAWSERTGGSILELHAYGVAETLDEASIREDLTRSLHVFYPETRAARVVHERFLLRRDCPAFECGSHARRPAVSTSHGDLYLAGDFARVPLPSALMERATIAGMLAANHALARRGVRPEPLLSVPRRGLFAGRRKGRREEAKA